MKDRSTNDLKPWDRQPGEPECLFKKFLFFRDLGRSRSLREAYCRFQGATKGDKRRHIPGCWARACARWRWVERAQKWDIAKLLAVAEAATAAKRAQMMAEALRELTERFKFHRKSKNLDAVADLVRTLTKYVSVDAILAERKG